LGFKNHLEKITINHNGNKQEVDLFEYKSFLKISVGLKRSLKEITHQIHIKGEIPFLLEDNFYMVNLSNGKTSMIKNRKQKELCGVLINALVRSSKNKEQYDQIKESIKWKVPSEILVGSKFEN
tara:strand:- start:68 stop:439 length:372 start_codon:yes stop_codon:yes gene_type:complete